MTMKAKSTTIGSFVKIDAGGQWHATIPKKGNRWIDMPGAALQKLEDRVRSQYTDDVAVDSDEATLEQAVGDLPIIRKSIEDKLAQGDEAGVGEAQKDAQEVLDGFPWEDWEENAEDPAEVQEAREALQAFVDIEPGDFLELAQEGGEPEDGDAEPAEGDSEDADTSEGDEGSGEPKVGDVLATVEGENGPLEISVEEYGGKLWHKIAPPGHQGEAVVAGALGNVDLKDIEDIAKDIDASGTARADTKKYGELPEGAELAYGRFGYFVQGPDGEALSLSPKEGMFQFDSYQDAWDWKQYIAEVNPTGEEFKPFAMPSKDQAVKAIEAYRNKDMKSPYMKNAGEGGAEKAEGKEAPGEDREQLASLVASGKTKRKLAAPVKPPKAWFENPNFKMGTPLTVTKEGRVFGHLALWGTCHAAFANATGDCIVVPGSNADYAMFHLGVVETAEGEEVPVGRLAMETTHADDSFSSRRAIAHYENTGLAIADIHAGEDEFGIWFSGALRPDATESQIRSLKASPLSGDWRYYPQTNDLELVMALAVNMPGFAVPRPKFMVASGHVRSLVAAGIVAPRQVPKAKVEAAKAGDQLAIDDIKYLQKLAARERANEAKILKQRALVASGVPDKIHALAQKLMKPTSVEEKK